MRAGLGRSSPSRKPKLDGLHHLTKPWAVAARRFLFPRPAFPQALVPIVRRKFEPGPGDLISRRHDQNAAARVPTPFQRGELRLFDC